MYCQNCGNNMPEGSSFCDFCGKPLTVQAPVEEMPTEIPLNKHEFFASQGSAQSKTLMRAAWIVFAICTVIGFAVKLTYLAKADIFDAFQSYREHLLTGDYALLVLLFSVMGTLALLSIFFGMLACGLKNTGTAITYLLFAIPVPVFCTSALLYMMLAGGEAVREMSRVALYLFNLFGSVSFGIFFDLVAAVCVLVSVYVINKEYKQYLLKCGFTRAPKNVRYIVYREPAKETEEPKQKECPHCGAQIPEESKFCLKCGAEIVEEVKNVPLVCLQCGSTLPDGSIFCLKCGKAVSDRPSEAETSADRADDMFSD